MTTGTVTTYLEVRLNLGTARIDKNEVLNRQKLAFIILIFQVHL